MNYWPRWINAITNATAHLTLIEMGAYDRLLDHYYKTEAPIPGSFENCCRIVRAMTKQEREAVSRVLESFFVVGQDGYSQERADSEIALAQPKIESARKNGTLGGRPKKTHEKPTGLPPGTHQKPTSKAPQSTSSLRSEVPTPSLRSGVGRASRLADPWELPDDWRLWAKSERPDLDPAKTAERFADFWHSKPGKAGTKLDWFATWRNWVRDERAQRTNGNHYAAKAPTTAEQRILQSSPNLAAPHLRNSLTVQMEENDVSAKLLG
jgi:uncharacterized protein YdaU (DUF1376 family)